LIKYLRFKMFAHLEQRFVLKFFEERNLKGQPKSQVLIVCLRSFDCWHCAQRVFKSIFGHSLLQLIEQDQESSSLLLLLGVRISIRVAPRLPAF
jgi:hypothetical protein